MAKAGGKTPKKLKPETTLQEAIHQWLLVTNDFEQWRRQLCDVLDSRTQAVPNPFMEGHTALISLRLLNEELREGLEKLVSEVDRMEELGGLTVEQIIAHTSTIHQWNQKIRYVLSVEIRGAA